MAALPPRVCTRCRRTIPPGRCPHCDKPWARQTQHWKPGQTGHRRWRRLRASKLQATEGLCEWPGTTPHLAHVVHHETDDYDTHRFDWNVLIALCNEHHDDATRRRARGLVGVPGWGKGTHDHHAP